MSNQKKTILELLDELEGYVKELRETTSLPVNDPSWLIPKDVIKF